MADSRSVNYRRQAFDNQRTAAIARCEKWEAELLAVEAGHQQVKAVWNGEAPGDAGANYASVLRQLIVDERQKIAVMTEDRAEMDRENPPPERPRIRPLP
jgi:hypothetical protein